MNSLTAGILGEVWALLREAKCELILTQERGPVGQVLECITIAHYGAVIGQGRDAHLRKAAAMAFIEAVQHLSAGAQLDYLPHSATPFGRVSQTGLHPG
ncbi:hypothetical protein [Deinococcus apachensis]|uniref:hypothetical protein n=1 Tax=Deinococcus apachensis TaxID=309886 RepID=UPI0003681A1E|nr:hypothetical protein [Deinococcus apachensis]